MIARRWVNTDDRPTARPGRRPLRARLARAGVVAVAAAGLLAGTGTGAALAGGHEGHGGGGGSTPVSFTVTLQNRTGVPCVETPGPKTAVVRGHIVGPGAQSDGHVAGTLYSHGDGYDETFWSYPKDKNYDYTADMARRGHTSVTIDRLGYGASDKPNGNSICLNTEADILSQIVGQLRTGTYTGAHKPKFDKVGLVGHSASGFAVEIEAAAFHDVDALGVVSSGELSVTPLVAVRGGQQQMRCLTAPDGYAGLEANDQEFRSDHIGPGTDPRIAADLTARRTKDACAGTRNVLQIIGVNPVRNATINVPVLSIAGRNDMFFPNNDRQAPTYSGSPKVTLKRIPLTGHAIAFGPTAPIFRNDMAAWLAENRL